MMGGIFVPKLRLAISPDGGGHLMFAQRAQNQRLAREMERGERLVTRQIGVRGREREDSEKDREKERERGGTLCRRLGGLCQSFGKSAIPARSRWSFVLFLFVSLPLPSEAIFSSLFPHATATARSPPPFCSSRISIMSPWAARCDVGPTGVRLSPPRRGPRSVLASSLSLAVGVEIPV